MGSELSPLLRSPRTLTIAHQTLTVPWVPASVWISHISRDPRMLAPAMASEGTDEIAWLLASGELTTAEVERGSHELIAAETGLKWYVALRLVYTSASPDTLGELTLSGVDPDRVSIGQWCAATFRVLTRNADKKQRLRIEFELELPPIGHEESWDDGNDYAAMVELARKVKEREAGRGK